MSLESPSKANYLSAYYVYYVKYRLAFIRQDSLCDALPSYCVVILWFYTVYLTMVGIYHKIPNKHIS